MNIFSEKAEKLFCRWKNNGYNNINIFLSLENPCTFLLAKEKTWKSIFNTNSELLQNCTEKQTIPFKTTVNWLFNNTWRHLVIGCFGWKICIFQQTVVRIYDILKVECFIARCVSWCRPVGRLGNRVFLSETPSHSWAMDIIICNVPSW